MNYYEKIKAMSIDEMAEFVLHKICIEYCNNACIMCQDCINEFKQWLEIEEIE